MGALPLLVKPTSADSLCLLVGQAGPSGGCTGRQGLIVGGGAVHWLLACQLPTQNSKINYIMAQMLQYIWHY